MEYKGSKRGLLDKKLVSVEYINGNRSLPMLHVHEQILNELLVPWKDDHIVKLSRKKIWGIH